MEENKKINELMDFIKNGDYEIVKEYMGNNPNSNETLELKKALSIILNEEVEDETI